MLSFAQGQSGATAYPKNTGQAGIQSGGMSVHDRAHKHLYTDSHLGADASTSIFWKMGEKWRTQRKPIQTQRGVCCSGSNRGSLYERWLGWKTKLQTDIKRTKDKDKAFYERNSGQKEQGNKVSDFIRFFSPQSLHLAVTFCSSPLPHPSNPLMCVVKSNQGNNFHCLPRLHQSYYLCVCACLCERQRETEKTESDGGRHRGTYQTLLYKTNLLAASDCTELFHFDTDAHSN